MAENQKMQAMIDQGGQVLNQQAQNSAQWAKLNAQASLKKPTMKVMLMTWLKHKKSLLKLH